MKLKARKQVVILESLSKVVALDKSKDEEWSFEYRSLSRMPKGKMAHCSWPKRRILLPSSLPVGDVISSVIHEAIHATLPSLSEDAVVTLTSNIIEAHNAVYRNDASSKEA